MISLEIYKYNTEAKQRRWKSTRECIVVSVGSGDAMIQRKSYSVDGGGHLVIHKGKNDIRCLPYTIPQTIIQSTLINAR